MASTRVCPQGCDTDEGDAGRLFCGRCGALYDRAELRSVKVAGFTGAASINPNVETFLDTGDPSVFSR